MKARYRRRRALAALLALSMTFGGAYGLSSLVSGPPTATPYELLQLGYAAGEAHQGTAPTDCGMPGASMYQEGYCDGYTDSEHPS